VSLTTNLPKGIRDRLELVVVYRYRRRWEAGGNAERHRTGEKKPQQMRRMEVLTPGIVQARR